MLLLLLFGAGGASTPPAPTKKTVGWYPTWRFTHDPAELERRLAQQRGFSRSWFDDFIAAETAATERVNKTKSVKHRVVLDQAAAIVYAAVEKAIAYELPPPIDMISVLRAAAMATRITASIRHAESILRDDEEDAAATLLLH